MASPYEPDNPATARAARRGIRCFRAIFSLFDALESWAENIALGHGSPAASGRTWPQAITRGEATNKRACSIDPPPAGGESVGRNASGREIAVPSCKNPKTPDHGRADLRLTPAGVEILFQTLRKLARRGTIDPLHLAQAPKMRSAACANTPPCCASQGVDTCDPRENRRVNWPESIGGTRPSHPPGDRPSTGATTSSGTEWPSLKSGKPVRTSLKTISVSARRGEIPGIGGVRQWPSDNELLASCRASCASARRFRFPMANSIGHPRSHGGAAPPGAGLASTRREARPTLAPRRTFEPDRNSPHLTGAVRQESWSRNRLSSDWSGARRAFRRSRRHRAVSTSGRRGPGSGRERRAVTRHTCRKIRHRPGDHAAPGPCLVVKPTDMGWSTHLAAARRIRQALIDLADQGSARSSSPPLSQGSRRNSWEIGRQFWPRLNAGRHFPFRALQPSSPSTRSGLMLVARTNMGGWPKFLA